MMGWYGGGMMDGYSVFWFLTWVAFFVDLVLLGVFLWKKIQK